MTPSPPASASPFLESLRTLLAPERVSLRAEDLETYARDLWSRSLISVAGGQPPPALPGVVVWPQSAAEVQAVVKLCRAEKVPLVPYGAGSGVSGGAVGPAGGLVLDTKRLRAVEIDRERGVVHFEPGVLGWHLEEKLNRAGLTLGHFPSSIMCSTAGGWVATRGAGQCSTKYGKIEDMVRSLELVTGDGERVRVENGDRGELDWVQLVVGSEGSLGVITRATCAVRPLPAARKLRGYSFPSVDAACKAIAHLMQLGLRPAVVRLYDEVDTLISGLGRHSGGGPRASGWLERFDFEQLLQFLRRDVDRAKSRVERWLLGAVLGETASLTRLVDGLLSRMAADCQLILGFEGEPAICAAEAAYAGEQVARCGGRDLGPEPGEHWLRHRYDVSFKMSRAFGAGAFTDTIEVAASWDRLLPLYREVRATVAPHALCMAHFSHAYADGCSIYFTVIARRRCGPGLGDAENRAAIRDDQSRYDALWKAVMETVLRRGATISHHHGVGRLKAPYMHAEHGASLRILSALKESCDPQGLCNPGGLLPLPSSPGLLLTIAPAALPAKSAQPDRANFLIDSPCELRLFELEQLLHLQQLSLGGLPPRAWGRTLGEALAAPRPSEANLEGGRLRDRRVQLRAQLRDGETLTIPPQPVPRRATGPDLGQVLIGPLAPPPEQLGTLLSATLRLSARAPAPRWSGQLFASGDAAVNALLWTRQLHGAAAVAESLLANRALLARVLGAESLPAGSWGYAVLVRASGPEPVATVIEQLLAAQLATLGCGALGAELCRDFWAADALCGAGATAESVAAFAARFPAYEQSIPLSLSTPSALAACLAALPAGDAQLLCGLYLHGLTLCTDGALPALEAASPLLSAHELLGPGLLARLRA